MLRASVRTVGMQSHPTIVEHNRASGSHPRAASTPPAQPPSPRAAVGRTSCFHCSTPCPEIPISTQGHDFCCQGCATVFELLTSSGLTEFYNLAQTAGVRVKQAGIPGRFDYLDQPEVRERIVDFSDAKRTRVTFRIPSIHCVACVWLLEQLFRFQPGIGQSSVNFPRREVSVLFDTAAVKLGQVVSLLASLGYEPDLALADLEERTGARIPKRLWLQLGVAGFAFGNNMLFSIAGYLGLDHFSGPGFRALTGWISLILCIPVVAFSALDYWKSAWVSLRHRLLNIDVPIAAGIAAIFIQSVWEVASGRGEGYFDSLAGLLFFLLCGKVFQRKTYDSLTFDRDYKAFFPLSTRRVAKSGEEWISLSQVEVGDRLLIRHGELVPADATLVSGQAMMDYSFVTGEAEPCEKAVGELLYAGGRQMGGEIAVRTVKRVSESYLTSLWNQQAFTKRTEESLDELTNAYSQRFTRIIIGIALGAAAFWAFKRPELSLKAFTSVLIVACPCALALAAPFTLGTAQRMLARRGVFLKNTRVLEALARVDAIVFDKTGTLTAVGAGAVTFHGPPLSEVEERWLFSMTRHSTHPYAVRVGASMSREHYPEVVRSFLETAGCGMEGTVAGHELWMGSSAWFATRSIVVPPLPACAGGFVHVAIDGRYRGSYALQNALRPSSAALLQKLGEDYEMALLSGDNERERERFAGLFGPRAQVRFNQSPLDKLEFVRSRQGAGRRVLMVGDGLNDAGALKQSDAGAAVVENVGAFSPACDLILSSHRLPELQTVLAYAKSSLRMVRASFMVSTIYNVVGIAIAARGELSPIVCAILMPLSSVSVIAFSCGAMAWSARTIGAKTDLAPALSPPVSQPTP